MKKGANADRDELKIGSYKLLTGGERLLARGQNRLNDLLRAHLLSSTCN